MNQVDDNKSRQLTNAKDDSRVKYACVLSIDLNGINKLE